LYPSAEHTVLKEGELEDVSDEHFAAQHLVASLLTHVSPSHLASASATKVPLYLLLLHNAATSDALRLVHLAPDGLQQVLASVTGLHASESPAAQKALVTNSPLGQLFTSNVEHEAPLVTFEHIHRSPALHCTVDDVLVLKRTAPSQ
tara:strand:- start:22 stop:462 length:441 start_codon:yes stop_codon:yes gene_type:complete